MRDAAQRINAHPNGDPQSLRGGEHLGRSDYRVGPDGKVEVNNLSHNYAAQGGGNLGANDAQAPISWHTHPNNGALDNATGVAGLIAEIRSTMAAGG